ncbi:MAG: M48 family metallopeptidase [Firmicutes bacterium]|nr:M48 family metallopeptidase [Bacillota bacterium]
MRSLGRTSATWKRYSTGRSFRQRATRLAAFAALILAAATGIAAAVVLLELRMPARLGSALSGAELDDAAVADLCVYIQKCSHLGAPDLPAQRVQSLVARKASRALDAEAPAASPSRAGLAREAHQMVLSENGGEWKSDFHRSRLGRIARVLAMAAGDKPESYRLTLLDTTQTNAVSTADGRIYVTRGLVTTSTDDEIAAVLAHEMHHIRSGHWYSWWLPDAQSAGDENDSGDGDGEGAEPDPVYEAACALADLGVDALSGAATTSYAQEFEADARGVLLASMCGYEGRQMYSVLTRLPSMPVTSHPSVAHRIAGVAKALDAMEDPEWISSHSPVKVAVRSVEAAMRIGAAGRPGVSGEAPGLPDVARACRETLDRLNATEAEMIGSRWLGAGTALSGRGRVMGRAVMITSGLSIVDVAVDTGFVRATAGRPGVVCGRIWLIRRLCVWETVAAQVLPGTRFVAPEWQKFKDELGEAAAAGPKDADGGVLRAAQMWRDTAVSDFAGHLDVYARGKLESSVAANSSSQYGNGHGQTLEAIGWARFLGSRRAELRAWSVRCEAHSPTLATVAFSSGLTVDGMPLSSNSTRLTLVLEEGQWKVAQVNLD